MHTISQSGSRGGPQCCDQRDRLPQLRQSALPNEAPDLKLINDLNQMVK